MTPATPGRGLIPRAPLLLALAAFLCFPGGAMADQWLQEGREPPLHPTIITTDYKGKAYPVVAVSAEVPEIEVEGKLRKLNSKPSYLTPRAAGFAPGFVTFKDQKASSKVMMTGTRAMGMGPTGTNALPGGAISGGGEYECTLVSSENHTDCYVAVLFYRPGDGGSPLPGWTAIAFRQIGDLVAGRETKVAINSSYVVPPGVWANYFSMVFTKGMEIRSDQSELSAKFFRPTEMAVHGAMLARYREQNPGADRPASAYLRFNPELPPGVDPRSLPPTITAKFSVTETGEIDDLEIDQVLDVKVDHEIRRALDGWLFMPRLKNGYPVRARITVPLSFGPS
jgi:hypothetical protein